MKPEHLDRLFSVSRPAVHPDGWAVVSAVRPDFAADAYVGQLWRVPLDGGAPRRITRGFRDTAPRISPDGRLIGFLRATPDGAVAWGDGLRLEWTAWPGGWTACGGLAGVRSASRQQGREIVIRVGPVSTRLKMVRRVIVMPGWEFRRAGLEQGAMSGPII